MTIQRFAYRRPLNIAAIFGPNTLTLTATAGLARHHAYKKLANVDVFAKRLLDLLNRDDLCNGTDEFVILQRAIANLNAHQELVKKDSALILEALKELDEHGVMLQTSPTAVDHLGQSFNSRFHNQQLFELIQELQPKWHEYLNNAVWKDEQGNDRIGKLTKEILLRQAIAQTSSFFTVKNSSIPNIVAELKQSFQCVVMDGFTFLRPVHVDFLKACEREGLPVTILHAHHPHRSKQGVEKYYQKIWQHNAGLGPFPTLQMHHYTEVAGQSRLQIVQQTAFSASPTSLPSDASVELRRYATRVDEVKDIVERAVKCRESNPECEIAFVSRTPKLFRNLILDAVLLFDTNNLLKLHPEFNLFHTPAGQFVSLLYQVMEDEDFKLTYDQFRSVLLSGWFGPTARESHDYFKLLERRFSRCQTKEDWEQRFRELDDNGTVPFRLWSSAKTIERPTLNSKFSGRMAENFVEPGHLQEWVKIVNLVHYLAEELQKSSGSRVQHVRTLYAKLDQYIHTQNTVALDLLKTLKEFFESEGIVISASEFGEAIIALGVEDEPDVTGPKAQIMAFEGIDGLGFDHVFMFGVDDKHSPKVNERWPMNESDDRLKLQMERYFFNTVIRSADVTLHLSWADVGENQQYTISPYINELIWQFGLPDPKVAITAHKSSNQRSSHKELDKQPKTYRVSDLAIYAHCPARFWFERTSPTALAPEHPFHERWLLQSEWLEQMVLSYKETTIKDDSMSNIASALEATLTTSKDTATLKNHLFPNISEFTEESINVFMRNPVLKLTLETDHLSGDFTLVQSKSWNTGGVKPIEHTVTSFHGPRTVVVDSPYYLKDQNGKLHPFASLILRKVWLSHKYGAETERGAEDNLTGWNQHAHWLLSHELPTTQNEWVRKIEDIENGIFTKRPTPTCKLCPAYSTCLGVPEEL